MTSPAQQRWTMIATAAARRQAAIARLRLLFEGVAVLVAVGACWLALREPAAAEVPLYEQEPYDQITLNKANDNAVLKVRPLDLPGRRVPENPRRTDKLVVRLLEDPDTPYELQWFAIEKLELFEDLILQEANKLVGAGRLAEAYDYFKYLKENAPTLPGLDDSIDDYLYEEAKTLHRDGQFEAALAVLRELYSRNPKRPELENALGLTTDELVEQHVADENYLAARGLVRHLAELFPEHAVVKKWEDDLKGRAGRLLSEARQAAEAGKLRDAHMIGRRLRQVWPNLPGAREFLESLHRQYSRVVVGVTLPAVDAEVGRMDDWASRRSSRLRYRTLMEFVGPGVEGGEYASPLGKMEVRELGLRLAFEIDPGLHWATGDATLTGYDLSRRLLAMAEADDPAYRVEWAELLAAVSVEDVYAVNADLHRPHVQPRALLQTTVAPYGRPPNGEQSDPPNGPYRIDSQTDEETVYVANEQYFAARPTQPQEIVERYYKKGAQAIFDLEQHRIEVIDRVNPWDLEKVREMRDVVVEPYAMPLVHCLVPNPRHPLLARRTFRRALVYGIHREAILNRLLGGKQVDGCRVVSGPFSPGISPDDPLGYAYDPWIEPRGYEPHMAIALARVAFGQLAAAMEKRGEKLTGMPELVLGHPPHEIARLACTSIQRQLGLVGISVTLEELPPGATGRVPDDIDLLYAELAMWEPVVDARRLLGEEGISGGASAYMSLALRRLDGATDWLEVGERLRQIHRIAHQEVAVVPLWQLTDHFAYHQSLKGVGSRSVSLYQHVEKWQPAFFYPAEGK